MRVKENILREVLDLLSDKYPRGLYEYLYKHQPDAYQKISILEDQINENFLREKSIQDLKGILRNYWCLHMKCIKSFQKTEESDVNPDIRHEMIANRERN